MKRLDLLITEADARILLESLECREREMARICEQSEDSDLIADVGNDLIELRLLLSSIRDKAVQLFGKGVTDFSRQPL